MVVASVKGWDGTRVLGVFNNEETALKLCEVAGFDVNGEDFYLDFVEMNKISEYQTLLMDTELPSRNFKRIHVYDEPINVSEANAIDEDITNMNT